MNLGDPELELVDPTPNIHSLFLHFDKLFFWTKLSSRTVVRWSKRMYSCAGICSYDRGGLCDIALSEPLLKLRPRKDLIETLLHEMIHAFLFVTCRDQDRDGHGPNFKAHMHRINKAAGLNISIYHSFHDEVELYQTHWWRCNGPCHKRKPHFGIVRRTNNRAPGPHDYWWNAHSRNCGGTFIKIKEPENKGKKAPPAPPKSNGDIRKYVTNQKSVNSDNPLPANVHTIKSVLKDNTNTFKGCKCNNGSTQVVTQKTNNNKNESTHNKLPVPFTGKGQTVGGNSKTSNETGSAYNPHKNKPLVSSGKNQIMNVNHETTKPPVPFAGSGQIVGGNPQKNLPSVPFTGKSQIVNGNSRTNNNSGMYEPQTNNPLEVFTGKGKIASGNPQTFKPTGSVTDKGRVASGDRVRSNSVNVAETVRNVWASKSLCSTLIGETDTKDTLKPNNVKPTFSSPSVKNINPNKHKTSTPTNSPPSKIMKIDDYFKNAATLLKDVYGQDFKVSQTHTNRLVVTVARTENPNTVANLAFTSNHNTGAIPKGNFVYCPVCNKRVSNDIINRHLDECLNKDLVNSLSQEVIDNIFNESKVFAKTSNQNTTALEIIDLVQELDSRNIKNEDKMNKAIKLERPDGQIKSNVNPNERMTCIHKDKIKNDVKTEPSTNKAIINTNILVSSGSSNVNNPIPVITYTEHFTEPNRESVFLGTKCPCCGVKILKPIEEHLDECLAFFDNKATEPEEGSSTDLANKAIMIDDDDDQFDESQTLNATGTKLPCPCCLEMIEEREMNLHLDLCLG